MERWLYIGAAMTLFSGLFGISMLPFTHMSNHPSFIILPLWMLLMAAVGSLFVLWDACKLAVAGDRRPVVTLRRRFDWKRAGGAFVGFFLLGLSSALFGVVKPQLGLLEPFRADPLLAEIDFRLFGTDPWRLLTWFDHHGLAAAYHPVWFLWLAFVLMYVVTRTQSVAKDSALVSYFVLWSLFGPLVHLAMPAAGPIFYGELGLGDRFAALPVSASTQQTADYLWSGLVNREFNAGGGISAMPSLHLATMAWSIIVLRKTKWFVVSVGFTAYIFAGSIVLGWHYAVDGFVGVTGAVLTYFATTRILNFGRSGANASPREAVTG